MTFRLGLTGSIGMGKSTTAKMFADLGCAVWDADAAVHRLYSSAAVTEMQKDFPSAIVDGSVSRDALRTIIQAEPSALKRIESIVHPLVRADRAGFSPDADIYVFDIPLLFETGAEAEMDAVACVYVEKDIQEARVLARGTMSREQFLQILAKQMPIEDKLERSDFTIHTDTLDHARVQVEDIVSQIREARKHA